MPNKSNTGTYDNNVFINCPFDDDYQKKFRALVFTILSCGFVPKCALENEANSDTRFKKIQAIIKDCRLAIHDISRTELDSTNNLPRFNMPFELGLFMGAKCYGMRNQKNKECIIFDTEAHRYQKFISDLGNNDIKSHDNKDNQIILWTRNWLESYRQERLAEAKTIYDSWLVFEEFFNQYLFEYHLSYKEVPFNGLLKFMKASDPFIKLSAKES